MGIERRNDPVAFGLGWTVHLCTESTRLGFPYVYRAAALYAYVVFYEYTTVIGQGNAMTVHELSR